MNVKYEYVRDTHTKKNIVKRDSNALCGILKSDWSEEVDSFYTAQQLCAANHRLMLVHF